MVKVVDSQAELYEMKNNKTASLAALVSEGQITQNRQIHTMIIMRNMVAKAAQWPIRAFTLLESLVTFSSGCLSHSEFIRLSHRYFSAG